MSNDNLVTPEEAEAVAEAPTPEQPRRNRKLRKPSDVDRELRHISERLVDELDAQPKLDPDEAKKVVEVLLKLKETQLDDRERALDEREKKMPELIQGVIKEAMEALDPEQEARVWAYVETKTRTGQWAST